MGRDLHFKPGSFYRTDDRTGFPQRAERTKKEWTGLIVDETVWEARQPQDLVKGVVDDQSVPDARPLGPNVYVGPISVALAAEAPPQSYTVQLENLIGISVGDDVGIVLDDGSIFRTTITALNGAELDFVTNSGAVLSFITDSGAALVFYAGASDSVLLAAPLPLAAPSGNLLIDYDG